ncbi:MAG: VOC family protein [Thermoplasmata archaeon]|nr:VOC family protein [Thermoplasmata archaeon]MCI4338499.1 VOC family protein [Thermoplasmata archaeon]MCI4341515.1 VOC family protein [Thermoplasmata archaeon]
MGGVVEGVGHIILPVKDMESSLAFYQGLLGFAVRGKVNPVWTELEAGGFPLTLYLDEDSPVIALGPEGAGTPLVFHVSDYPVAEAALTRAGVKCLRESGHQGVIWDPAGNALRLHDHRARSQD